MADRKQGAGLSSGSSAAVHKANCLPNLQIKLLFGYASFCHDRRPDLKGKQNG